MKKPLMTFASAARLYQLRLMGCDGEREGEETPNMSEIASRVFLGGGLPFQELAEFPLRAGWHPHLTTALAKGKLQAFRNAFWGDIVCKCPID